MAFRVANPQASLRTKDTRNASAGEVSVNGCHARLAAVSYRGEVAIHHFA